MSSALPRSCHTISLMANETEPTVIEAKAEPLPEGAPEGRLNVGATAFMTGVLQHITGQTVTGTVPTGPQKMCLVVGTMPTAGAAPATTVPATGAAGTAISWTAVTGGGAAVATTSATVAFNGVAANNYVGYAVFNNTGVYLYSKAFTAINVPTGATGNITVTATHTYDLS